MLTTTRRDQRTRRQALFTLETLDDRLVLSAAAAGVVGEAVSAQGAVAEARHARHEARHARHEAKLARHAARLAAHSMSSSAIPISVTGAASAAKAAPAAASAAAASAAATTNSTSAPAVVVAPNPGGSAGNTGNPSSPAPTSSGPLPSNVGAALQSLYSEFKSEGDNFTAGNPIDKSLLISGSSVEVSLKIDSGSDFNTALSQLQSDGLQVSSSSATYGVIDGMLPIAQLPAAAQIASSVNPVFAPQAQ